MRKILSGRGECSLSTAPLFASTSATQSRKKAPNGCKLVYESREFEAKSKGILRFEEILAHATARQFERIRNLTREETPCRTYL
jgi:hypothetical protein